MIGDLLTTLVGLVLLAVAADRLVLSAARLAHTWGLSPILIGAVVIGLGTSLPELLVSGLAAARPGGLDLAVGNIVGSNIANLSLVLGVSVLLSPITRQSAVLKREGLLMIIGSALLAWLAWDNTLTASDGVVLGVGLIGALMLMAVWSTARSEAVDREVDDMPDRVETRPALDAAMALGSLGLTLLGAKLLVTGAAAIAVDFGISEAVIGLTLVAIGTSLPELATVVAAARRNENGLVLGNVLGSNLFNALAVGGVAATIGNGPFVDNLRGPLLAMLAASLLVAALASLGRDTMSQREGLALLAIYPLMLGLA